MPLSGIWIVKIILFSLLFRNVCITVWESVGFIWKILVLVVQKSEEDGVSQGSQRTVFQSWTFLKPTRISDEEDSERRRRDLFEIVEFLGKFRWFLHRREIRTLAFIQSSVFFSLLYLAPTVNLHFQNISTIQNVNYSNISTCFA